MFNTQNSGYSLSDIAAVTDRNRGGAFGDGDGGAWWVLILFFLFASGGWDNGWGNNGRNTTREEITYGFDMNNIENGIRGIQQGLCDGFYSQNSTMLQGFNGLSAELAANNAGLQQTLCQSFNGVNTAMLQGFNGIQAQMSNDALVAQQCCCETQNLINSNFANLNYNLATQNCETRRAISDSTRDIIDSQNNGTRAILDFLTQDKIATLTAENQSLKFAASQANQNVALGAMMDANTAEIIRRVSTPCPVPAYVVPNPNSCYEYTITRNSCGNCLM